MNGWAATSIIKSDEATREIPVIVLSAHAMEEYKAGAIASVFD